MNVCESGIAAVLAQDLVPGETVAIEVQLSPVSAPLRTRAMVRYQDKLSSGLEFMGLPAEQREAIRSGPGRPKLMRAPLCLRLKMSWLGQLIEEPSAAPPVAVPPRRERSDARWD